VSGYEKPEICAMEDEANSKYCTSSNGGSEVLDF